MTLKSWRRSRGTSTPNVAAGALNCTALTLRAHQRLAAGTPDRRRPAPQTCAALSHSSRSQAGAHSSDKSQVLGSISERAGRPARRAEGAPLLFSAAVADRVIGISPCTGVSLPEAPHHRHYIPSDEQIHQLAEGLPERYAPILYVAAGCGMRGAEITGLEVDALDFDACEIDITQQLVCVTGQEPYLGPPKTKTSVRTIEAPAVTMAALARHIETYPPVEVEIWDRTDPDKRKHHRRIARLIFTTIEGRPIHRSTWALIWAPAARKAGISKGTGLHSLRHAADPQRRERQEGTARARSLHAHDHAQHVRRGVAGHRPADPIHR